jgi:hypothetical protein
MNNNIGFKLVEPGTKYFFSETLKKCKQSKNIYYNHIYNISLFLLFFGILGTVLYYNYKGKNGNGNKEDEEIKNASKQMYIMNLTNKLKEHDERNNKVKNKNMITDLPNFESEFETTMRKFL